MATDKRCILLGGVLGVPFWLKLNPKRSQHFRMPYCYLCDQWIWSRDLAWLLDPESEWWYPLHRKCFVCYNPWRHFFISKLLIFWYDAEEDGPLGIGSWTPDMRWMLELLREYIDDLAQYGHLQM